MEDYFSEKYVDERMRIQKNSEANEKNHFLERCYQIIDRLLPGCIKIRKPEYMVSFCQSNVKHISEDEGMYYRRVLDVILSGQDYKIQELYGEWSFRNKTLYQIVNRKKLFLFPVD